MIDSPSDRGGEQPLGLYLSVGGGTDGMGMRCRDFTGQALGVLGGTDAGVSAIRIGVVYDEAHHLFGLVWKGEDHFGNDTPMLNGALFVQFVPLATEQDLCTSHDLSRLPLAFAYAVLVGLGEGAGDNVDGEWAVILAKFPRDIRNDAKCDRCELLVCVGHGSDLVPVRKEDERDLQSEQRKTSILVTFNRHEHANER